MRSILKSHKRNDSSVSDTYSPLESPANKTPVLRPNDSPTIQQSTKMTPPTNSLGLQQSAKSSPKKLLTPIKKMFGHHSKTPIAPSSTETLQAIINSEFEPPKDYRFGRQKHSSFPNLSDLANRDKSSPTLRPRYQEIGSPHKSTKYSESNLELQLVKDKESSNNEKRLFNSESKTSADAGLQFMPLNASDNSIATSKNGFHVTPANNDSDRSTKLVRENSFSSDEEDSKDSDTSSQFSFVKDNRGGRNTSIKYYKTKPKISAEDEGHPNYFSIDDTRFDADAISDYDYDNNGVSDADDIDEGFPGSTDRYGEFLSDKESFDAVTAQRAPISHKSQTPLSNSSPDLSAGWSVADKINSPILPMSDLRSPGYAGDILDTYLESRSPVNYMGIRQERSSTPIEQLRFGDKNLSDEEPGMGLGIGISGENSETIDSIQSVTDIMDTLRKLEGSPKDRETKPQIHATSPNFSREPKETQNIKTDQNELFSTAGSEALDKSNRTNRHSVMEMMNKLSILGNMDNYKEEIKAQEKSQEQETVPNKVKKRYSWFSNEDPQGRSEGVNHSGFEDISCDGLSLSMDEDIIDEINLIPENFDFNDEEQMIPQELKTSSFLRSNSYNKRPTKTAMDFNSQEHKINFRNKTVTFYRSKSLDRDKPQRIPYPTRAASLKSVTSFNDENISEGEEDDIESKNSSINQRVDFSFYAHPNSLIAHKSASLDPISESDTPKPL